MDTWIKTLPKDCKLWNIDNQSRKNQKQSFKVMIGSRSLFIGTILLGLCLFAIVADAQDCDCTNPTATCQCYCDTASNYITATFINGKFFFWFCFIPLFQDFFFFFSLWIVFDSFQFEECSIQSSFKLINFFYFIDSFSFQILCTTIFIIDKKMSKEQSFDWKELCFFVKIHQFLF